MVGMEWRKWRTYIFCFRFLRFYDDVVVMRVCIVGAIGRTHVSSIINVLKKIK